MLVPVCVDGASKEWSIVELQGNLVVDDNSAMADVDIGTLRYVDGVPTIRIGNHILSGKVAKLPKPFAILQKDGVAAVDIAMESADGGTSEDGVDTDTTQKEAQVQYEVVGIARTRVIFNTRPKPVLVETHVEGLVFGVERYNAPHLLICINEAPMQHGQSGHRHQQQQQQQAPRPPAPPVATVQYPPGRPHHPQQYPQQPIQLQWHAPRFPPPSPPYPSQYQQQHIRPKLFAPQAPVPVSTYPGGGVNTAPRYYAPAPFVPPARPPRPPGHFQPRHYHSNYQHPPSLAPQPSSAQAIEAQWVEEFERKFIPSEITEASDARVPPLRCVREAITRAQALIAQLQDAATDAIAIEKRMHDLETRTESQAHSVVENAEPKSEVNAIDQLEISRLKLQHDRKIVVCEALKTKLEAMNPQTLFCASERELAQVTRFAKQVQKKQTYRKKAKKRRRVESTILQALQTPKAGETQEVLNGSEGIERSECEQSGTHAAANKGVDQSGSPKPNASVDRENARKLLLLLEMKERRKRNLNDEEHQEITNMRAMALKSLKPKPRLPQLKAAPNEEQKQRSETLAQREAKKQAIAAKAKAKRELVDPESIDMGTLISVRRAWDQFLVAPNSVPGASSIPPVRSAVVILIL